MELSSVIANNNINTNIISAQNRNVQDKTTTTTTVNNNKIQNENSQSNSSNVLERRNIKEQDIINSIEKANKKIQGSGTELSFSVHSATKQIMIKIIDKQSKEIVKEIPSEKILDMVANIMETSGLIIDRKM